MSTGAARGALAGLLAGVAGAAIVSYATQSVPAQAETHRLARPATAVCTAAPPARQCVFTGSTDYKHAIVLIQPAASDTRDQVLLSTLDYKHHPGCWITTGGIGPGGFECISASGVRADGSVRSGNNVFSFTISMNPDGTVILQPCGKASCAVSLTAGDVRYLHRLEARRAAP